MNTRTIAFIEEYEDLLSIEIELALKRSMNENFIEYCKLIRSLYALSGVDTNNYKPDKSIYYIENES